MKLHPDCCLQYEVQSDFLLLYEIQPLCYTTLCTEAVVCHGAVERDCELSVINCSPSLMDASLACFRLVFVQSNTFVQMILFSGDSTLPTHAVMQSKFKWGSDKQPPNTVMHLSLCSPWWQREAKLAHTVPVGYSISTLWDCSTEMFSLTKVQCITVASFLHIYFIEHTVRLNILFCWFFSKKKINRKTITQVWQI